jgi:hypothetical protein
MFLERFNRKVSLSESAPFSFTETASTVLHIITAILFASDQGASFSKCGRSFAELGRRLRYRTFVQRFDAPLLLLEIEKALPLTPEGLL